MKGLFGPKKQSWAELQHKKDFFGPRITKTFENKVQKFTNFKEKKGLFGRKKQAGAEQEQKKVFFGQKF